MNDLPKVLVIASTPFSKTKNNGKTLSSFFETYDRNMIAQFSYSGGDSNAEVCDNYFVLTKDDVVSGKKGKQYTADELITTSGRQYASSGRLSVVRKVFHYFSQRRMPLAVLIKNRTWDKADYSQAYKWIDVFDPDVVFFQGFSMAYGYDFALNVCEKRNIPMIIELTDDYTHRLYPLSIIEKINNTRYLKVFAEAIRRSSKVIVISELMKEEYEKRFGGNMIVMMNSVTQPNNTETKRVTGDYVYAGNLLLNRWRILKNLGKALSQSNPGAVLNIYTPDEPPKKILKSLTKVKSINYGGRLKKDELEERLKKCEYVVHVEAFDKKNRKITRLSMSTKISEYVASGAKLLAIGPSDVASMRRIAECKLGMCINSPTVSSIISSLKSKDKVLIDDSQKKQFLIECDSHRNSMYIQSEISNTVKQKKSTE